MYARALPAPLAAVLVSLSLGTAWGACYAPAQQLPSQTISGFTSNPNEVLSRYPNGGAQMISYIRDLAASDPATLAGVIGLLGTANRDQQSAIGSGLGQAARICVRSDQAFATQIQQAISASNSNFAKDSYAFVNPDTPTGAVAGAGGGGGGGTGSGGPTGGGFGTSSAGTIGPAFGTNSAPNIGQTTLTGGRTGGAGSAGAVNSGITAFTATTPVSPR
ncbi:MAG TPA: hypothetical protein VNR11_05835 [Xanthobacteraceae bacterium]|nr:hypothetical protein [Xanthobacteraceae bacterium]